MKKEYPNILVILGISFGSSTHHYQKWVSCLLISFSISGRGNITGLFVKYWSTQMHLKHSQFTYFNASIWNMLFSWHLWLYSSGHSSPRTFLVIEFQPIYLEISFTMECQEYLQIYCLPKLCNQCYKGIKKHLHPLITALFQHISTFRSFSSYTLTFKDRISLRFASFFLLDSEAKYLVLKPESCQSSNREPSPHYDNIMRKPDTCPVWEHPLMSTLRLGLQ